MSLSNCTGLATIRYRTHMVSHAGGRSNNQDAARFAEAGNGSCCWVLADGLGGMQGGELAANLATAAVIAAFHANPDVSADALVALADAAQNALHARQRTEPDLESMRTTLVLLLADGTEARWGHIGDSRLYAFRQGQLVQQTRDHSVPQALAAAGQIRPADIRTHADRSQLLRAVGQAGPAQLELAQATRPQSGDAFLLCSDGAWEVINELELEADLAKSSDPETWVELLQDRLLMRIRPDHDNYTMAAIFAVS